MNISSQVLQEIKESVYQKFQFVADQVDKDEFVNDRIKMATEVGAKTYHEILFIALTAPLLRPNKYAIQAVRETTPTYLASAGEEDLRPYHDEIIEMAVEYHEHILYPSIRSGRKTTAKSHDPRYSGINTWQGFSSELHHRIPLGYDWDAVAYFVITDSTEHGKALQIQEEHGPDTLVYKSVMPNGCRSCKTVYQNTDGTPKTIKVKDLIHNNIGVLSQRIHENRSVKLPTSGPSHLYCTCQLHEFTGYEPWAK